MKMGMTEPGITFETGARNIPGVLLEKAGVIKNLSRQVKFVLIPSQRDENGKVIERECSYKADFKYEEDGKTVVEDVKGFRTKEYVIKRKLMLYQYGIRIREV